MLTSFINTIFPVSASAQNTVIDNLGEAYFFYKGVYPEDGTPSWGDENWAANGITHDDNYWYITSVSRGFFGNTNNKDWVIWKIPVSERLDQDFSNNPRVKKWQLSFYPGVLTAYGHAGDLDYWNYNGVGYLVIPLTGGTVPIIAFFRASDLHLVNYAYLDITQQKDVGWCAVSNDGDLYTSRDDATKILRYDIDWHRMVSNSDHNSLRWVQINYPIKNANGGDIMIRSMQGGEFTPDGNFLYVSSGLLECTVYNPYTHTDAWPEDGIHVFQTSDWREIQRSTNKDRNQSGCFQYNFDNDNCHGREPEGLTIWDLADGQAPHVTGGLHVLLDDHNWVASNNISLRHYARFKAPADVKVITTNINGVPATNPQIAAFLRRGSSLPACAVITHNAPSTFPPGKTAVTFTITDHATVRVKATAYVTVVNKYDECLTAMELPACLKKIADNYTASLSKSIPNYGCYTGMVKDVWFKIIPSSKSLSVETYQVPGGLTNTVMQAFSGSCGNLHEIACDDNSGDDDHAKITLTNLPNLNPVYIRVTDYSGNNVGKFGIYYKDNPCIQINNSSQFQGNENFTLYPNPTSGIIHLKTNNLDEFEVSIFDLTKRLMVPRVKFLGSKQLDLSSFANGVYFVEIYYINVNKRVVKKIVKMK